MWFQINNHLKVYIPVLNILRFIVEEGIVKSEDIVWNIQDEVKE